MGLAFAQQTGLDMRVVVPGNLCIGPIASTGINGTMTRIRDIMTGKNTLKGAADLAIVHVQDVVDVHCKCMTDDAAKGRYIVAADMAPIADVFAALKEMYPQLPVAEMGAEMDIASGVLGAARKIDSRAVTELGLQFKPYRQALKDSIDSMIVANMITGSAESPQKKAKTTSSTKLYAITGAYGFIACNLIKTLVANGHSVRGTVRDIAKHGAHLKSLGATITEVKNLTDEGALAKVFAGVHGVFHMAAVHPQYGFADTPQGRAGILATAVGGTVAVLSACQKAGVKRVVLTSSLAAIECGNDEGTLSEAMWSKAEVYDSEEKLKKTQWATHYTYVKSKVEQEKAALAFAQQAGLDMRVVVPGNLCIGPIASTGINGTMTRIRDIMTGKNTLKGAADLAIVHVQDVADVHCKCMSEDAAKGRYIVAPDMAKIKDVFAALKEMYPQLPMAEMGAEMDIASGVLGAARKIDSRAVTEFGMQFKPYRQALKDSIDSMIAANMITVQ